MSGILFEKLSYDIHFLTSFSTLNTLKKFCFLQLNLRLYLLKNGIFLQVCKIHVEAYVDKIVRQ